MNIPLKTQELALNQDNFAVSQVCLSGNPRLYDAVKVRVDEFLCAHGYPETVDALTVQHAIQIPSWYVRGARDVTNAMRSMGYHRQGLDWVHGKKPKREKPRVMGARELKKMTRQQLHELARRVSGEIKRRDGLEFD